MHPSKARWTVTPREGKNSDSSDSRKHLNIYYSYVLTCSVDSFELFSLLFSFFFLPSVVAVDFIGTVTI